MSACAHRTEDGCSFIPCSSAFLDRKCACGTEVREDEAARLATTTAVPERAASTEGSDT